MTRKIFFILFLLALIGNVNAQNLSPLKNVINRVCPWMTGKYILKSIPKENGKDVFELSTQNGKLIIKASNIPSGGMGFNWYLKNYCHRFYSHCGNNLAPVSKLPVLKETIHKISPYPYRYYLNYCTLNYSMSFQGPGEWEKELDWMVLNGINLALMTNGMEKVWLNTLTHFGYSREEALKFIPGPAFNAWWLMGNLEGWGGPVSQSMIDERSKTEQFIVTRMRELNIEPVFQCFYGMVPISLKNHYPKSPIIEQGKWAGDFDRPSILLPGDSLFKEMAAFYYKELKRLYGQAHFFGGEPFHEGGRREGITESDAAHAVYSELIKHNPGSVWVLQGWSGNPSKELLNGLKSDETLVLDLFGEAANYWEKREGYDNHNWAWCTVSNFGEKTGLYGRLERLATEPPRALA
ncbi:MAG: alpha-N-acetylglucosaminidase, partial [Bacteroidota bacterium]|nr:alpha-N-acetylglucosaminidase [Bacteroidota bacterium]